MAINSVPGVSLEELSDTARAIHAMLMSDPAVRDCAVVVESERDALIRVYLVGTGTRPDRQFGDKIDILIARFNTAIDVQLIAVSNLPLTTQGKIDTPLLSKLPIIDGQTVAACEHQLHELFPNSTISVDITERRLPVSPLHCSDLGIAPLQTSRAENPAGNALLNTIEQSETPGPASGPAIIHS
ncbi:MAG TPA: hypothetical protein DCO71_06230, partial [Gammaproteobacteria bacterium]|nr:hypothetical protein [Gammaproteobacteria bacterium]